MLTKLKNWIVQNEDKCYAWLIGFGLVLFAFQHQYIHLGIALNVAIMAVMLTDKKYRSRLSLGSKWVYIPLLIIVFSIILVSFIQYWNTRDLIVFLSNSFLAVYFFVIYLIARILGKEIFTPFAWLVVVEAISVIVYFFILHHKNGGLVSLLNYNTATGLLVFGSILAVIKRQWLIVLIGAIGLVFTGSEEGIVAIVILGIAILIRKDISKKLLIPVGIAVLVVILGFYPFSYAKSLYAGTIDRGYVLVFGQHSPLANEYWTPPESNYESAIDYFLDNRKDVTLNAFQDFQPLGHGYQLITGFYDPHNVPLIVYYQVGILAALAWLFLTLYGLIKTSWKYAFLAVIALSLFDNYIWTRMGVWWFALIGVATVVYLKSDLIFKRDKS